MMKRLLFTMLFAVSFGTAFAAPMECEESSFAAYEAAGSCTINGFLAFGWDNVSNANPNVIQVPSSSITVTPFVESSGFGFRFTSGWGVASPDRFIDNILSYQLESLGQMRLTRLDLRFNGIAFGTGQASVSENYQTASGTGNLAVSAPPGIFFASTSLDNLFWLGVSKDILVSAGSDGSGAISFVTNGYGTTAVPELMSFGYIACGLSALLFFRRKLQRQT